MSVRPLTRPFSGILWLAAVVCVSAWLPPCAAQNAVLPPPIAPRRTPALVPEAPHASYWIVSARDCGGELGPSQCHRFRVWGFDERGNARQSQLSELIQSLTPQAPVCLMLHGSFVDWETVTKDSLQTNRWLRSGAPGCPLNVIFFTWPSDDTPRVWLPNDVAVLGNRAGRYGFYVAEIVSLIPDDQPICLLGHSHGARMAVSTLHLLGGGEVDETHFGGGPYGRHRIRAVLAAAAFDHDWLNPGRTYDRAVHRPEGILNLVNRRDLALGFYPLHRPLATTAAIARSGLTAGDRLEIGHPSHKLVDYDVTARVRAGHIWPHYYEDRELARAIAPYVFFRSGDATPSTARSQSPEIPYLQVESHRATRWSLGAPLKLR